MTAAPGDRRLLGHNRDFTLLWVGGAAGALGNGAMVIATPLLILKNTGTAAEVGLVISIVMVITLLISVPAGSWVDRFDKRRLMQGCELGRMIALGLLTAAILTDHASLPVLIVAMGLTAVLGTIFAVAEDPAVRVLVPDDRLALAIARNQARGAAAGLCGPPVGGVLFVVHPSLPFAAAATAALVSLGCVSLIRARFPIAPESRDAAFVGSVLDGLRFVWGQGLLRATLLQISGLNLVSNGLWTIAVVIIGTRGDPSSAGLLMTIGGIGGILGALAAPTLVRRLSLRTILVVNRLTWSALMPLFLILDHPVALGSVLAVLFFIGPTGSTAVVSAQLSVTPDHLQGRASSARGFIAGLAAPLGAAMIGIVLDHAGRPVAIILLCGVTLLLAAFAVATPTCQN